MPQLAYILSLPRSGSTVLSAMLDRRHGIISPPESSFPQVLSVVSEKDRDNPRWMAALYIESSFVPTPLSLDDAESCMIGTNKEILVALGRAVANKTGRDPNAVQAVVWKTPRTVGINKAPVDTGGSFLILRRNPHNVFESQFRVGFGEKNRNPYRFALFRESYEHAFSHIPAHQRYDIHYDELPDCIDSILDHIGVEKLGFWENATSSFDMAAANCYWMKDVTSKFDNKDAEKRSRLSKQQVRNLRLAMSITRPLRPLMGPLRHHYDWISMKRIFALATNHHPAP